MTQVNAWIVDGVRTPFGRYGGALAGVRADDLGAIPLRALVERNPGVDWAAIDDVLYGCANQAGEDNRNVARMVALLAGLPVDVPGSAVNRLCGSSLDTIGMAGRAIRSGEAELMIAGGVESMTRAPFVMGKAHSAFSRTPRVEDTTIGWRFVILLMKAQALLSLALVSALTAWLVWQRRRSPLALQQALFLLLWNPLLLFDIAGNAHNDLWMVLGLLLAVALAERRRFDLALTALTAGALVKFVPLLIMPLLATAAVRRLGWRQAVRQLAVGLALSLLLAWLCYRPFWPLADPLRLAQRSGLNTTSILTLVREIISAWAEVETANASAAHLGQAVLVGLVGLSVWRLWRAPARSFTLAAAHLLLAILLLATAWFQTWYLAWVWPLLALRPRARLAPVLFLLSTTAWFKYLLFSLVFGAHWPPLVPYWQQNVAAALMVIAPPLGFWLLKARQGLHHDAMRTRGRKTNTVHDGG